ncbi:MAG: hypothetical protein K0S65_6775 [Labilithrix sp.]|nr:hypothetical protein [Labilithrix sp.]
MHRILHALATERFLTAEAAASLEEWLVRPFRRRAAERALREAHSVTRLTVLTDLARVARLRAAGMSLGSGFDDVVQVAGAYARLPIPADRRAPLATLGLLSAIVVIASSLFAWRLATRPFDAAAKGTGRAFAERFGGQVADVANGARPSPEDAMRRVFPGGLEAPAGDAMKGLFAAQVEAANDVSRMPLVFQKTREVNDAFGKLGQPWYIDARYYRNAPLLYAFYREREDEGRADGFASERIVFAWRLDHLNISKAALGYTHREAGAALVLYDQVEEFLIRDVLPALVEGEKVDFIDTASRDPKKAWQEDIETRSARMVRESFASAADRDKLLELGKLLARRRAIVRRWRDELALQQRILREPSRLIRGIARPLRRRRRAPRAAAPLRRPADEGLRRDLAVREHGRPHRRTEPGRPERRAPDPPRLDGGPRAQRNERLSRADGWPGRHAEDDAPQRAADRARSRRVGRRLLQHHDRHPGRPRRRARSRRRVDAARGGRLRAARLGRVARHDPLREAR